jgi:TolA-binding protein
MNASDQIPALEDRIDQLERDVARLRERNLRSDENFADLENLIHALSDWIADVAAGAA